MATMINYGSYTYSTTYGSTSQDQSTISVDPSGRVYYYPYSLYDTAATTTIDEEGFRQDQERMRIQQERIREERDRYERAYRDWLIENMQQISVDGNESWFEYIKNLVKKDKMKKDTSKDYNIEQLKKCKKNLNNQKHTS